MPTKVCQVDNVRQESVKKVIVVGNGPSAITLSYLLSGNVPCYNGQVDDPHLHRRLNENKHLPIVLQDLEMLANGCEGRSNNPVSVFFDMLNHPDADLGLEKPTHLEWVIRPDLRMDHLIIGKGKPGGCWETMDGDIQTVSLGNWMELPNRKLASASCDSRVPVSHVARYYQDYVEQMGLTANFVNHSEVTSIREVTRTVCEVQERPQCRNQSVPNLTIGEEENAIFKTESLYEGDETETSCSCSEECSSSRFSSSSCCSSSGEGNDSVQSECNLRVTSDEDEEDDNNDVFVRASLSNTCHGLQLQDRYRRLLSMQQCYDECSARDEDMEELTSNIDMCCSWNPICNPTLFVSSAPKIETPKRDRASTWSSFGSYIMTPNGKRTVNCFPDKLFEVKGYTSILDEETNEEVASQEFKYLTKNVVLASGSQDLPNRLNVPGENLAFVLHSLAELETRISDPVSDPVLVVGAGLSVADALVTTTFNSNIRTVHAFRRSANDPAHVFKMLPKTIYPEYHKVYQLMKGEVENDLYTPLPEHKVIRINPNKTVILKSNTSEEEVCYKVSFVVILVGSSPDLSFLEPKLSSNLGIIKNVAIGRNNPVDIDLFTNEAVDVPGVYAMGPLVGDNFVRFLQGGALSIMTDVLGKEKMIKK